jgi:carnitine 3-dehydrogenase
MADMAEMAEMAEMKVAIIGAGVIGAGWAARFALHGASVSVFDPLPDSQARVTAILDRARVSLSDLYDRPLPEEGRVEFADDLKAAVTGADWVQENVPERLEVKQALFAELSPHLHSDAVLASSTSGFKPSVLTEGLPCAERFLVCHPFQPVYLLPAVEVVPSRWTEPAVLERGQAVLESIGMRPTLVEQEIDAHIADRLLEAVWREALWLVKDGIASTAQIDAVIRNGFGLRWAQMGLFETYRIAGGDAGMRHFLAQFGPALKWPWSRLTDVPDMDEALVELIAAQSDEQAGAASVAELMDERDRNLVAILKALKNTRSGAGQVIADYEAGTMRTI